MWKKKKFREAVLFSMGIPRKFSRVASGEDGVCRVRDDEGTHTEGCTGCGAVTGVR